MINRIKEIRKRRNMTLQQLADLSGKSIQTIVGLENGDSSPSLKTAYAICDALKCNIYTLYDHDSRLSM